LNLLPRDLISWHVEAFLRSTRFTHYSLLYTQTRITPALMSSNGNQSWGAPFPSLHLWPLQETFSMKMIHLPDHQRVCRAASHVEIGRQTNNKTTPGERNAYFDSKVLSRTHAEIWTESGKVCLTGIGRAEQTDIHQGCQILQRHLCQRRKAFSRGLGK
jgi:hypothetical protein